MRIVESFLTRNPCYAVGRKITVKGLMLHSVGCPQPRASAFIRSWDSPAHGGSCVHGFIDGEDGTVYQTLPWNHRGGTAAPVIGGAGTIPISGWRCVSPRVFGTRQARILPVWTWMRPGRWRRGLTGRRWGCSPCSAGSTGLTRWRMAWSSATGRAAPGGSHRTTGIRSTCGGSLAWGIPWTGSAGRSGRPWRARLPAWTAV